MHPRHSCGVADDRCDFLEVSDYFCEAHTSHFGLEQALLQEYVFTEARIRHIRASRSEDEDQESHSSFHSALAPHLMILLASKKVSTVELERMAEEYKPSDTTKDPISGQEEAVMLATLSAIMGTDALAHEPIAEQRPCFLPCVLERSLESLRQSLHFDYCL